MILRAYYLTARALLALEVTLARLRPRKEPPMPEHTPTDPPTAGALYVVDPDSDEARTVFDAVATVLLHVAQEHPEVALGWVDRAQAWGMLHVGPEDEDGYRPILVDGDRMMRYRNEPDGSTTFRMWLDGVEREIGIVAVPSDEL